MSSLGHPSQPNYFALYAGSTFGTTDDNQYSETGPTIDTILQANGLTFQGYVDTTGGGSDFNHDPWVSFPEGYSVQTDFTSFPALFASGNYASLPSVSFVIPSITNDMHSGTVQAADAWLQTNMSAYAQWAKANNSLLIVTWDESDDTSTQTTNQIPTLLYGANVVPGNYNTVYDLYSVTSTIMAAFNLTGPNNAATAPTIQVFGTAAVAPSITTPANGSTDATTTQPVISGVGVTGDIVTISIDGTVAGTATVAGAAWTFTPTSALSNGSHTITATQAAAGGASSAAASDTFTVSLSVPAAPTITFPSNGSIDTTTTEPVISGGGLTGDTVTINIDGAKAGTATVVNSAWTFTPTTPLINGSHTVTATQAAAGGQSSLAATDTFTVNLSGAGGSTVKTLFSGITDPNNYPPENALAVGPGFVVMAESSYVEWTNLTGGSAFKESLYTLFSPLGSALENSLLDARVVFDSVNQRFVLMAENLGSTTSDIDIAVSKDANPNDGWYLGSFNSELTINGDKTQADMPYLSVDGKNIYVSEYQYGSSLEGTQETVFSNSIYSGGVLTKVASSVAPASVGNARNVAGANGLTFYVSNKPAGNQDVLTIQNFNNATNAFSAATTINLGNSDQGANSSNYTVAQKGTSLLLNAYDSRIASLAYWNGYVYGLMEIEPTGTTVPQIEWFKINVSNPAAPTLAAQGVVTGAAIGSGVGVFNGSLAVDAAGDLLINFTASSANMYPSDYYVYQTAGSSSFSAPNLYQASTGFFNSGASGAQRWGAYSTAIVDPNNPNSFWISNEYVANNWWQTATAQIQLSTGVVAPPAPTFTTPASGSTDTTTPLPVISGGGVTGDTVTINIDGVQVGTALVANNAWSFTPTTPLTNASHTITATQAATGGPSSTAATDTFTVSVPPAAPTITTPVNGSTDATNPLPVISGGGVTGDTVTINIDGVQVGTALVANSAWSFTPTTPLTNASHTITATQAATGGPSSTAATDTFTVSVPPAAPTFTTPVSGSTDTTSTEPVISGGGVTGDTVTINIDGVKVGTALVASNAWTFTPTTPLTNASHTITATQAATGGPSSVAATDTFIVNVLAAPAAPTFTTPASGSTDTTTTEPVIAGSGVSGDTVTINIDGVKVGTALVANNAWTFTPTTPLTNASHTITATQAATGGPSSTAATDTFIVNVPASAPAAPTISTPVSGSTDTTSTEPVISGGGVTGDTVTINIDGVKAGTALVANSAWTFTPTTALTNASHTITATQATATGPSSTAATDTFTVSVSGGAVTSTVNTLFAGISDPNNYPPQNALAVGPSYVVTAESSFIEWTNLTGGAAVTQSLYDLFSPLGAALENSLLDVRVAFDSVNQRFVVMAENLGSTTSDIDIAVSKDANPNDGWYLGSFNSELTINGDVTQADLPYLSVDGKNIYVSENQYGSSLEGTQETVFSNSIYSGGALTKVASQVAPSSVGNARNVTGANGLTFYVSNAVASGQDVLTIQNFNNATNAFSAATTINLANSDQGASAANYTVAQKGSSLLLDANDSRIASLAYSNGYVYGLMEIEPTGTTVPEIEWFKISVSNPAAPTLAAQGVVTGAAIGSGVGVFNGSLAVDAAGDLLINFTASSANMYPSDYYVYQAAGSSTFSAPNLYQASTSFFNSGVAGVQGWGANSTAIADPNNSNSFWISNEYVANSWWQTVTAQVSLTSSGSATTSSVSTTDTDTGPEAPSLAIANTALTVNAGSSVGLGITATPVDSDDQISVTITGLPSYESIAAPTGDTISNALQTDGTYAWTVTESSANVGQLLTGLTLASSYTGTGHPVANLGVTASNLTSGETASSATQTIVMTDPPVTSTDNWIGALIPATGVTGLGALSAPSPTTDLLQTALAAHPTLT